MGWGGPGWGNLLTDRVGSGHINFITGRGGLMVRVTSFKSKMKSSSICIP